ncbi:MAG: DUF2459 domain-containing protein [Pseudohongiella sp.]|uniref:DUF2459 domain-containing protein n=1 Tax=Pseudohongiella sp. TaxID=1979412 RepID=UPI0034A05E53
MLTFRHTQSTVWLRLTTTILLLTLTACLGPAAGLYPADPALRPVPVYLTAHGWHVGIVVEAERVLPQLPDSSHYPNGRWLEFGWGDADYYPNPDPGAGLLLKAALLPTSTVMHIVGFDQPVQQRFPYSETVPLQLSSEGMQALAEFLATHMQADDDGQAIYEQPGLYGESAFFAARGIYLLPHTSNMWSARALRSAGLPITPIYAVTQSNLMWQAEAASAEP